MAKEKTKSAQSKISQNEFENLCAIQCTETEICGVFGVSHDTLWRWCKNTYGMDFAKVFAEKREFGKASLRRTQWKHATKNPTMAIFLGKQYLGQRDVIAQEHEVSNGILTDLVGALNKAKENKNENT